MFVTCDIPFTVTPNGRIKCSGVFSAQSNAEQTANYLASCSVPYISSSNRVRCNGSLENSSDINLMTDTNYLLTFDTFNPVNSFMSDVVNLNNVTVQSQISITASNSGMSLSPVQYSQVLSMSITSIVMAFAFNLVFRQIINRN